MQGNDGRYFSALGPAPLVLAAEPSFGGSSSFRYRPIPATAGTITIP